MSSKGPAAWGGGRRRGEGGMCSYCYKWAYTDALYVLKTLCWCFVGAGAGAGHAAWAGVFGAVFLFRLLINHTVVPTG